MSEIDNILKLFLYWLCIHSVSKLILVGSLHFHTDIACLNLTVSFLWRSSVLKRRTLLRSNPDRWSPTS